MIHDYNSPDSKVRCVKSKPCVTHQVHSKTFHSPSKAGLYSFTLSPKIKWSSEKIEHMAHRRRKTFRNLDSIVCKELWHQFCLSCVRTMNFAVALNVGICPVCNNGLNFEICQVPSGLICQYALPQDYKFSFIVRVLNGLKNVFP